MQQVNENDTREQFYNNELKTSNLDHVYTNNPDLISNITTEYLSNSDHKIVCFRKNNKERPKNLDCTRRRLYKNMSVEDFLKDIHISPINEETTRTSSIDVAAENFSKGFLKVLNKHAPMKTVQNRVNYCSALSESTKRDIECRNKLREIMTNGTSTEIIPQYKALMKAVKLKVKDDKQMFNENRLESKDSKSTWKVEKAYWV